MSWLLPLFLGPLAVLVGGAVAAAYLARRKARREVVGSLRLLRAAAGNANSRRLIPRLKHPLSLLLVLLAVAIMAAGLAGQGCTSTTTGRLLLVVDGGAGMGRQTPGGSTLLDAAREPLSASLDATGASAFAVVVAGPSPRVPVGLTQDASLVMQAVEAVVPEGRADVPEAIVLADTLCADPERDVIVVISDGLTAAPSTRCPLRRLDLPAPEPNVGLATLVARRTDGLGLAEAVVTVAGDWPDERPVEVELRLGEQLVDAFTLTLPAGGEATAVRRVSGDGEVLTAALVGDGGSDPVDDRAEVRIGQVAPVKVGLVTDRPQGLLATALGLHPGAMVEVVGPDESQSLDSIDIGVLEVSARPPPVGRIVLFGDAVQTAGLQEGEVLEAPRITRWAFDDPLLRYLDLDDLVVQRAWPLQVPGSGQSLIEADGRPIAVRGELSGRPMVALGFGTRDSDLALRVDFLHLIANLLDQAAPVSSEGGRRGHDPGRGEIAASPGALSDLPVLALPGARGQPWWVWGVLGAIVLLVVEAVLAALRPWRRTTSARKIATFAVRAGVLLLLVGSLLGLQWILPGGAPTVVFVVDRSASVGEVGLQRARERVEALAGQVPAGARAVTVWVDGRAEPREGTDWPEPVREDPVPATDLGAGVQAALGHIDPSAGGRVVLLTDGGDTRGDLEAALEQARARGVPVDVVALPEAVGDPALLGLELGAVVVRPGETVQGTVTVRGAADGGSGRLQVTLDDETVYDQAVTLQPGRTRERFEAEVPEPDRVGARRLSVRLVPDGPDAEPGNNQRSAGLTVGPPPRVLAIAAEAREVEGLRRTLVAEGMEVDVRVPSEALAEDLARTDVVIIGDVPLSSEEPGEQVLDPGLVGALRPWISEGGGLITLGGDRTYELGGWGDSTLAAALPLDLSAEVEDLEPAVTLVQVLDNSASMGDWSGYQTKMALANEGAVASMRLLRPRDVLSVLAVNTQVDRVVPAQPVTDPLRLSASIRSIKPGGGGIYTYTSLIAAERVLTASDTPLKHVVLYADAQDAEEMVKGVPFGFGPGPTAFEVATRLKRNGATLSVIALGDPRDQHVGFLQDLARLGGGRFRITREPSELRALFVEETREVVRSIVHDGAFQARAAAEHPTLTGIDLDRAPPLLGYVEVRPRDTADVLITGPEERPVLVTWQYGLGHVAAWSSDLGPRWGRRWLDWEGYPRLVVQQVRWALRPPVARGAGVEVGPHHDGLGVVVTRYDDEGLTLPDQGVRAWLVPDARPDARVPVDLRAVTPGRFEGSAAVPVGSAHRLVLEDRATGERIAQQAVVVPEGLEREVGGRDRLPDLAERTGGILDPDTLGPTSTGLGRGQDLGWWLALLAWLLLPLDAWVRVPVRG